MRQLAIILFVFVLLPSAAFAAFGIFQTYVGPVNPTFTPLHLYYLNPSGNDSCNGTSPSLGSSGACAWLTPNHAIVCGDVIIAAAGSYTTQFGSGNWGAVSNCPSTSGGIDGTGGVYESVVLCAGPNMSRCAISSGGAVSVEPSASNWAIEGFTATQNTNAGSGCYIGVPPASTYLAFISFINDIASTCSVDGFGMNSSTTNGVDEAAIVGVIAYNTSPSIGGGICGSGVSIIPANDSSVSISGTHVFQAGIFSYDNINAASGAGCNTDGEGVIFESWCLNGYSHQGVLEQSAIWGNGGPGILALCGSSTDAKQIYVFNNTVYGNSQDPHHAVDGGGEVFFNGSYPSSGNGSNYALWNNLVVPTVATPGNSGSNGPVIGINFTLGNNNTSLVDSCSNWIHQANSTLGSVANNNPGPPNEVTETSVLADSIYITDLEITGTVATIGGQSGTIAAGQYLIGANVTAGTTILSSAGGSTWNLSASSSVGSFEAGAAGVWGYPSNAGLCGANEGVANTWSDPVLASPTSLPSSAPNCASYASTTACMNDPAGYNVAGHLAPTASGTSGLGYRAPTSCRSDSFYPTWLKGIVYLQWNSGTSTITENYGLVTKPCGL